MLESKSQRPQIFLGKEERAKRPLILYFPVPVHSHIISPVSGETAHRNSQNSILASERFKDQVGPSSPSQDRRRRKAQRAPRQTAVDKKIPH